MLHHGWTRSKLSLLFVGLALTLFAASTASNQQSPIPPTPAAGIQGAGLARTPAPSDGPTTTVVTKYFDDRRAAMALNYDTELYLGGMIHSGNGWDPPTAAARSQNTRTGWPNILQDTAAYGIPVSFNICGHEAVFGDTGVGEIAVIDIFQTWHSDPHWSSYTWYSDKPASGGNYLTVGDLSGTTRSYGLVYGGDLTEQTMNSPVPHEISYHNFGHESLSNISEANMDDTFRLGVEYHKRIGSKLRAEAPPWNDNPSTGRYPIYVQNGIFVFNRSEGPRSEPYEPLANLWVIPRAGAFTASTDMTSLIDSVIADGVVLADYSHPEDGFQGSSRTGFQTSLAYAKTKVDSRELWATTLSEIGRYWEAKSDATVTAQLSGGKTVVDVALADYDAVRFGIPYLTFKSPMPDASAYARISVDYPTPQTLNSSSSTVHVAAGEVTYTVYLNPAGTTHVEIEGVGTSFTGGVDINEPVLSVASTAPSNPIQGTPITVQAATQSTDALYTVNLIYQRNSEAKDSRIMTLSGAAWETAIGPFSVGDVVHYYVSATDNSGRREVSPSQQFTVLAGPDYDAPQWRDQGQSDSSPVFGASVALFAQGMDTVALRTAVLETNETGSWERKTAYGSPMAMGDVANAWTTSSFTWSNPLIAAGTTVSWRIYYRDAAGHETATDVQSFTIEAPIVDTEAPQFFDPSVSSTHAGQPAQFSLRWTDNVSLSGYIFGFDNGTGTFVDDPYTAFTERASGAPWWDAGWQYRKDILVDNAAGSSALTDYPVLATVNTAAPIAAGKMNPRGGDIRFVDGAQELSYWIESGLNTTTTRIWVKVPGVPAGGTKTISMYYGNPNRAVPRSDGGKTFRVFDNFGGRGWEEFKYGQNPVNGPGSSAGGSGTFSSVMRESDTLWRMYSSYDSDGSDIGMSTSTDGLHWTHQGVVLRKGAAAAWDSSNVWCPAVWKEGGTYYMLYPGTGPLGIRMGLATSPDGVNFTKYAGNPVFNDSNWASGDTESPCFSVLKENGTYYVMYNTLGAHRQSSITYSTDLMHWSPAYGYPRFPGGLSGSDWNYNTFCGNVFKYEDRFYLVLPGQDTSRDYAKFGLYTSGSPLFPESDTEFKGILFTGKPGSWEAGDMDTPWTVRFDGKMHMYYAACGSCWSQTGVAILNDVPQALVEAYPPGNYLDVTRSATASQMIMPPVGWQKSLAGYEEINGQNFLITLAPAVSGRAVRLYDGNAAEALELYKDVTARTRGIVSAWVRSSNNTTGEYDVYLYGDSHATLALAAGLGPNGVFHYWNGAFVDTATPYQPNTWYLVEVLFDTAADKYALTVYDASHTQLLSVQGIDFGAPLSAGMDRIKFRTSTGFNGDAYLDDVVLRDAAATEPGVSVGAEGTQVFQDAWARTTKTLDATPGKTIRWRYSAADTNGNWRTSATYSFFSEAPDYPPAVTQVAPADGLFSSSASIDFKAVCSDERDIAAVSLFGDWGGSWQQVDSRSGSGLNGTEVTFSKTVPDGAWTWNVRCDDSTGNSTWGTARRLYVDAHPAPWWSCTHAYRQRLTVHENSGQALADYPVYAVVDTAAMIAAGKLQADCDDIRVTYDGAEIPSQVTDCGSATARVWLQTSLNALQEKRGFYLYCGSPTAAAPNYGVQSGISWNDGASVMNTGKITATFCPAGGTIGQVKSNTNNQNLMTGDTDRTLGYLFTNNAAVYYIFQCNETDDSIALTVDGPIVKIVTATSGEVPRWTQQYVFYNNQEFIDLNAVRPAASTERYLVGAHQISPDGVFSSGETNEILRVDNSSSDVAVAFDDGWRYSITANRGYAGVVDPSFTNRLAFLWDQRKNADFTWKPRSSGAYSLFIGGNGATGNYGTIDSDTFDYRCVLRYGANPSNAATQSEYDSYLAHPPTVTVGPEESPTPASDTTPPVVTTASPTHSTYRTATIPLIYTLSEGAQACSYVLDGAPPVSLPGCGGTTLAGLGDGWHELAVRATDCAGNPGGSSVIFQVLASSPGSGWWNGAWHYRIPVTLSTGSWSRKNEPIEFAVNFTQIWSQLGETGLSLDSNSIRVVEHDSSGNVIGEVASQFDQATGYNPATNAAGTVDWILSGTTPAATSRYYYVYFDSTNFPKAAPSYVTDLAWNGTSRILSNQYFSATIGTVATYRAGFTALSYGGVPYTVAGGNGIYYLASGSVPTYGAVLDGPVKKTIKITQTGSGEVSFTLYSLGETIRADGRVTGSAFSFTEFPYAHGLNPATLTNQFHYYRGGAVVNETVASQGWLNARPDEGWACYDGSGAYKDLCVVTNGATLSATNNFWRSADGSARQLIFPAWNPNPTFPVYPVSWIVMADTYQGGRDFWSKLSAPVGATQGTPQKQPTPQSPVVSDIPDQTVNRGQPFAPITLDSYVTDPDTPVSQMLWTTSGNVHLAVHINISRVATVTPVDANWTGSETINFIATDPDGVSGSNPATFTVNYDLCYGVTCTALDQCHEAGVCDPGTGLCSNPVKPDGTACNDGIGCTSGDVCAAGLCGGTDNCAGEQHCDTGLNTCVTDHGAVSLPSLLGMCSGGRVDVPITIDSAVGLNAMHLVFTYDSAKLTPVEVHRTPLTGAMSLTSSLGTPGVVDIVLSGSTPLGGGGVVAWVTFDGAGGGGGGGISNLVWTTAELNGGTVPSTAVDGSVEASGGTVALSMPRDLVGEPGGTIVVPLVATPAAGVSADIVLRFNPAVLSATAVATTDITAGMSLVANLTVPGEVRIALYGTVPLTGSGPLVDITFTVVGAVGDMTELDLVEGSINEGAISSCLSDGLLGICATNCDDGSPCTADSCAAGVCRHVAANEGASCNDGSVCTQTDTCAAGVCVGGNPLVCVDGNACTDNLCDPVIGCIFPNDDTNACSDGDPCTSGDHCASGACAFTAFSCDVGGNVYYYRDSTDPEGIENASTKGVPEITLAMTGRVTGTTSSSNPSGAYAFSASGDVTVAPQAKLGMLVKPGPGTYASGISSLDATRIAQSTVGFLTLTQRQEIAAEVSGNARITSYDAALVAQMVVALIPRFPVADTHHSDWAYVPASRDYSVGANVTGADFLGILYGDVTGNWGEPAAGLRAATSGQALDEDPAGRRWLVEQAAVAARRAATPASKLATIYVASGPKRLPDGRFEVVLGVRGADGILAIDLLLASDPAVVREVTVERTGLSSGMVLTQNGRAGRHAVSLFGAAPMQGAGPFLKVVYRAESGLRRLPLTVSAEVNEGAIPIGYAPEIVMGAKGGRGPRDIERPSGIQDSRN